MYPLFDPPVNEFSPPEAIRSWIAELESLHRKPEYAAGTARAELERTLAEARECLQASLSLHAELDPPRQVRASGR
jgi:hypothetical protein